ncbi:uncharacterized protein VP01_8986g1, partial [Puccinia sorghi]
KLQEQLRINLEEVSQRYKQQVDKLILQHPTLNIGDSVSLNAHNIRTTRPTPKLSLLEPAKGLYPGKTHPPLEPVNFQDHLEWEVSRILDARLRKGKLQYLVEWAGHQSDKDQTSWEPANHF